MHESFMTGARIVLIKLLLFSRSPVGTSEPIPKKVEDISVAEVAAREAWKLFSLISLLVLTSDAFGMPCRSTLVHKVPSQGSVGWATQALDDLIDSLAKRMEAANFRILAGKSTFPADGWSLSFSLESPDGPLTGNFNVIHYKTKSFDWNRKKGDKITWRGAWLARDWKGWSRRDRDRLYVKKITLENLNGSEAEIPLFFVVKAGKGGDWVRLELDMESQREQLLFELGLDDDELNKSDLLEHGIKKKDAKKILAGAQTASATDEGILLLVNDLLFYPWVQASSLGSSSGSYARPDGLP
jgi:hypothetical protein